MSPSRTINEPFPTIILVNILDEVDRAFKVELIRELDNTLSQNHVDSGIWACLWLADIPRLRAILDAAKADSQAVYSQLRRKSGLCLRELGK